MALTDAGRILTEQQRVAQLEVRRLALRDYLSLWPMWEGDEESFFHLATATLLLIRNYHRFSSDVARGYFESFRRAEGASGEAAVQLALPIDEEKAIGSLIVTGRDSLGDSLRAGKKPEQARQTALVRTSGSVSRQVLTGGRETLLRSVAADRGALGWGRVTDGDPCAFCALLAGRGPVYKAATVDFEAHDECGCTVEAVYHRDADWTPGSKRYSRLYNEAIGEARESGELRRGTKNDLLNAFRRSYERERA